MKVNIKYIIKEPITLCTIRSDLNIYILAYVMERWFEIFV